MRGLRLSQSSVWSLLPPLGLTNLTNAQPAITTITNTPNIHSLSIIGFEGICIPNGMFMVPDVWLALFLPQVLIWASAGIVLIEVVRSLMAYRNTPRRANPTNLRSDILSACLYSLKRTLVMLAPLAITWGVLAVSGQMDVAPTTGRVLGHCAADGAVTLSAAWVGFFVSATGLAFLLAWFIFHPRGQSTDRAACRRASDGESKCDGSLVSARHRASR